MDFNCFLTFIRLFIPNKHLFFALSHVCMRIRENMREQMRKRELVNNNKKKEKTNKKMSRSKQIVKKIENEEKLKQIKEYRFNQV